MARSAEPEPGFQAPGLNYRADLGALGKAVENCFALSGQKAEPLSESHGIPPPTADGPEMGCRSFLPDEGVPKGQGYGL